MKKLILSIFILSSFAGSSQNSVSSVIHSSQPFPTIPKITVTGTKILDVVPNQIFFTIILKEERLGRKKTRIDSLEKKLRQVLGRFQIPSESLTLKKNTQRLIDRKRDTEVEITHEYSLLLTDQVNLRLFLLAMNKNGFNNIQISHVDHTKKAEFMDELRQGAMRKARTKAQHLLGSIDKQPGALLTVLPLGNNSLQFSNLHRVNGFYNSYISSQKFFQNDFNYEKLQLRASYQLTYEIKN
jgi:uncharacterized protein